MVLWTAVETKTAVRVAVEDNKHLIPKKFKGLSACTSALHLDITFAKILEESGQPVSYWLTIDIADWRERVDRYNKR